MKYGGQVVKVDRYMDKKLYYKLHSSSLLVIIRSRILINCHECRWADQLVVWNFIEITNHWNYLKLMMCIKSSPLNIRKIEVAYQNNGVQVSESGEVRNWRKNKLQLILLPWPRLATSCLILSRGSTPSGFVYQIYKSHDFKLDLWF